MICIEVLAEHLRGRRMLLVLDNFEQVMAAAPAVAELLRQCPELKVLVTSREALRVQGERALPARATVAGRTRPALDAPIRRCTARRSGCSSSAPAKHEPSFALTDANAELGRRHLCAA